MTEFKVGDIVEAFGCRGVVVNSEDQLTFVKVCFGDVSPPDYFYKDGKSQTWHKEPSLKLIERPKNKVKKVVDGWVNVYDNARDPAMYGSTYEARNCRISKYEFITCIKVTGEYEVEE